MLSRIVLYVMTAIISILLLMLMALWSNPIVPMVSYLTVKFVGGVANCTESSGANTCTICDLDYNEDGSGGCYGNYKF